MFTTERLKSIEAARLQLIDLGDEKTAKTLDWVILALGCVQAGIVRLPAAPSAAEPVAEVPHDVWTERVACARVADAFAHESGPGERRYSGNVISARILSRTKSRVAPPAPSATPVDPMDWPLPCDVTVGHGTMRKGVALRTLVMRMKVLYEMATGRNADEVASRRNLREDATFEVLNKKLKEAMDRGEFKPKGNDHA